MNTSNAFNADQKASLTKSSKLKKPSVQRPYSYVVSYTISRSVMPISVSTSLTRASDIMPGLSYSFDSRRKAFLTSTSENCGLDLSENTFKNSLKLRVPPFYSNISWNSAVCFWFGSKPTMPKILVGVS